MVPLEQIEDKAKETNPELVSVRDNFVESIGKLSESLGLSRIAGQLYALLYISGQPLSLDDMVETLKVSKGSVSVNIRELEKWGAVRKIWVKRSRRDFYLPELDIWKIINNRLKIGLEQRLYEVKDGIAKAEEFLENTEGSSNPHDKETLKIYKERIEKIKELHNVAHKVIETVSKIGSASILRKILLRL